MPEFDGTIQQFCQLTRALYPNCRICYGEDDQIVIYTGAAVEMGGEVVEWLPEDEDQYQSWCDRNPEVLGGKDGLDRGASRDCDSIAGGSGEVDCTLA
jgi:hypothetical protein